MNKILNCPTIRALAFRTFRQALETPIAYIIGLFFYGFVGGVFGMDFFFIGLGTVQGIGHMAPWVLWIVIPALTMGLLSEELRSGTFEHLSTLPLRDWEIVLGKYFGFALFSFFLILGLAFFPVTISFLVEKTHGMDWGAVIGMLAGLYVLCLSFGAMGLYASSLAKNQVVALIIGVMICTFFFFIGQFYSMFPGLIGRISDFVGVVSHLETLNRGVWDLRDLGYFVSVIGFFLFLTVQRLSTRRF